MLCGNLVDLEGKGTRVISPRRGGNGKRATVLDSQGRVHAVTTKRLTELHLRKVQEEKER